MHTKWIILISTLISTPNIFYYTGAMTRMEWVHSNNTGNRFYYCNEQRTRRPVCFQICCIYIHSSSFTIINVHTVTANISVTIHIKSPFTVYIYNYSFKVTSNENIHIYSSMCIMVVHGDVHLSSSVPQVALLLFYPFSIYSSLTIEWQVQ